MNITLYGDSILKGVVLEGGRYSAGHPWDALAQRHGLTLDNRCRFGATAPMVVERMEKDAAREEVPGTYTLIEFGGNDCNFDWAAIAADPEGEYLPITEPKEFLRYMDRALEIVKQAGSRPLLTTLPPIDPKKYLDWICRRGLNRENILRWLGDECAIYRFQEHYSHLLERLAAREGLLCVDLREAFLQHRRLDGLLCEDGIHPSPAGQQVMAEAFEAFIKKI